jgi:hypothetical protein
VKLIIAHAAAFAAPRLSSNADQSQNAFGHLAPNPWARCETFKASVQQLSRLFY